MNEPIRHADDQAALDAAIAARFPDIATSDAFGALIVRVHAGTSIEVLVEHGAFLRMRWSTELSGTVDEQARDAIGTIEQARHEILEALDVLSSVLAATWMQGVVA